MNNELLTTSLADCRQRVELFLNEQLEAMPAPSARLKAAMQYSLLNGGKRIRPWLAYATGSMLGAVQSDLDAPAAALESIHTYSLIHDDLPAMDDDDLRRGKASCHIAFDEATAILAGDALQTFAFSLLTDYGYQQVSAAAQLQMVSILAKASGISGMCGGQALDIEATGQQLTSEQLAQVHANKTGALIAAAVKLGICCAPDIDRHAAEQLNQWANLIGLIFQVQDDILDVIGDTQALGKQQGADQSSAKVTFPSLLGLEQTQAWLQQLQQKALQALHGIPYNTELLVTFTDYLIKRDR